MLAQYSFENLIQQGHLVVFGRQDIKICLLHKKAV